MLPTPPSDPIGKIILVGMFIVAGAAAAFAMWPIFLGAVVLWLIQAIWSAVTKSKRTPEQEAAFIQAGFAARKKQREREAEIQAEQEAARPWYTKL